MNRTHETEDPITHDQDRFVHPDETRTPEQIAYDEKYAIEPYGDDAADEYWADFDELHGESEQDASVEDKLELAEQDITTRDSAVKWLEDAAAEWEKERTEVFEGKVSHYSGDERSKQLYRVLENGFYATSDDNVYMALRTVQLGTLRRADHFSSWDDGSYKAAEGIEVSELSLDDWRVFTNRFAELQEKREEAISNNGEDPLKSQMQVAFESTQ